MTSEDTLSKRERGVMRKRERGESAVVLKEERRKREGPAWCLAGQLGVSRVSGFTTSYYYMIHFLILL